MVIGGRSTRATTAMKNLAHMVDEIFVESSTIVDTEGQDSGLGDFSLAPNGDMI